MKVSERDESGKGKGTGRPDGSDAGRERQAEERLDHAVESILRRRRESAADDRMNAVPEFSPARRPVDDDDQADLAE